MNDIRLYKVTDGHAERTMLIERLKQEDEAIHWALKTGNNRMCYNCKNDCKTKNQTWTGCVRKIAL